MADPGHSNSDTPMLGTSGRDILSSLPQSEIQELLRIREERKAQSSPSQETEFLGTSGNQSLVVAQRKDVTLPKWNGKLEDFDFYIRRLELRVVRELEPYTDSCKICLDMIDTLPEEKQARAAEWFRESARTNEFNWRQLALFFRKQFEDKQARQAAAAMLNRMEQGYHQYFQDFLKDFEYRLALCGGSEAFTSLGKTQQLKNSINSRLRRALVGVKLPPPTDYKAWVEEVMEVAAELEALADYRPKGATQTSTVLGAPKSGSAQSYISTEPNARTPKLDSDGDISMGGTNAVLAAIRELKESGIGPQKKNNKKPRAPWRSKEDFNRLFKEGRCTRCTKKGHVGKYCDSYSSAQRPEVDTNSLETVNKLSLVESENEGP